MDSNQFLYQFAGLSGCQSFAKVFLFSCTPSPEVFVVIDRRLTDAASEFINRDIEELMSHRVFFDGLECTFDLRRGERCHEVNRAEAELGTGGRIQAKFEASAMYLT